MRIAFINPPLNDWHFSRSQRSPGVIKSGTMYYPYWLAYATGLAMERGHECLLVDCPADGIDREAAIAKLRDFGPGLVVVETSTPSIAHDLETVELLKAALPKAKFCCSGTHVTSEWKAALDECEALDFVTVGEYDYTISELAEALDKGEGTEDVLGLAWRGGNGPQRSGERPLITDMDALPWAAPVYKKFLNPRNYLFTIANSPMVMLISGRGCRARCFYCVYPQVMHGHDYRTRSPADVVAEMKWIQENMPEVKEIVFEDDTFTSDRARAQEIAHLVKQEGVTLPFFANIRVNVDHDTLAALKDAGLRQCATGFESGDATLLVNMRKGQTLEKQQEFMENCRKLGILVHGCFMVGFPGETRETLQKTLNLAIDLDPDSAQFYPVMPYPGTGAYQWAEENGFLATTDFAEWLNPDGGHRCVLNLPGLTAKDLEDFCEHAVRRFHFRPRYMLRKAVQAVTDPQEGVRSVNAFKNFLLSLVNGEKAQPAPVLAGKAIVDEAWGARTKVPKGRMEHVAQSEKEAA
ncbi:MAG: radical SAM protein [Novosphingobium sp.]|nr:radical SAM protein [Novosphingobium sp.]